MENTIEKLDILFSLALNYPVIKHWGYSMTKPIACVMPSIEEAEKVIRYLSPFPKPKIITSGTKPKTCERMLTSANSEFVFIYYENIPQAKKIMQMAITAVQTGRIDEKGCNVIPLIFFRLAIPTEWKDSCFLLYLTESIPFRDVVDNKADSLINAYWEQDQIVQRYIRKMDAESSTERVLMCAVYFLFPQLVQFHEDSDRIMEEYLGICEQMIRMDEDAREVSGTAEVFISLIYGWIESNDYIWIYPTSKICEQGPFGNFLYDREYFYMPDNIFDEITRPMRNMQSGVVIKQVLKDEGILVCDQSTAYTSKVMTWNVYGMMNRVRALKFRLDQLNQTGDIPLLQLCGIKMEGK